MTPVLLLTLSVDAALAQAGASTGLMGRVTDSSAAAVPGAAVTLTNVDTGSVRAVTTNSTGDWEARFLPPGHLPHHLRTHGIQDVAS